MLTATTSARPSCLHQVGNGEVLVLERVLGVDQQHHHLGEADGAHGVAGGELLRRLDDARLAPQPRGVEQPHRPAAPQEVGGDRIAREARAPAR